MKYPCGQFVRVGDHIWWDEGACVGYVQRAIESPAEMKRWGVDVPSIMVGNHPYSSDADGYVCLDENCFDDEGIGCLTTEEEREFCCAKERAIVKSKIGLEDCGYAVGTEVQNHVLTAWVFHLIRSNICVETIRIPTDATGQSAI